MVLPAMRLDLRAATVAALRGRVARDFRLVLAEMLLRLEAIHKAGNLPHNYLVSPQGHVVVADFDSIWPAAGCP